MSYNAREARDKNGKWTSGTGGGQVLPAPRAGSEVAKAQAAHYRAQSRYKANPSQSTFNSSYRALSNAEVKEHQAGIGNTTRVLRSAITTRDSSDVYVGLHSRYKPRGKK